MRRLYSLVRVVPVLLALSNLYPNQVMAETAASIVYGSYSSKAAAEIALLALQSQFKQTLQIREVDVNNNSYFRIMSKADTDIIRMRRLLVSVRKDLADAWLEIAESDVVDASRPHIQKIPEIKPATEPKQPDIPSPATTNSLVSVDPGSAAAEDDGLDLEDEIGFEDEWGDDDTDFRPISTVWQTDFSNASSFEMIYIAEDNFKYGQYNGLNDEGLHFAGMLDMIAQPSRDDHQSTGYWNLKAEQIGLETGSFVFSVGKQGNYEFNISYDSTLAVGNNTGRTPYSGQGSDLLTLPSNWTASNTTQGMSLDGSLFRSRPELARHQLMLEIVKQLSERWSVTASYNYENKSGDKVTGAAMYIDAANPHAALLMAPMDYENNQFDVVLDYIAERIQMQLNYTFSELDNRFDALSWQNPFTDAFIPAVNYPNGFGSHSLPSDNKFQQIRFNANFRIAQRLRLRIDGSAGRSKIDSTLLPYTTNSLLTVDTPLPVEAIGDELETRHFYSSLLYNITRRMTLNLKYRLEDRANKMPVYPWQYVRGDAIDQSPALKALFNRPRDITKQKYTIEGTWRLPRSARLTLGYDYDEAERTFSSVEKTEEERGRIAFKMRLFGKVTARLEYAAANLSGSDYNWSQSFFNSFTTEQISLIPDDQRFSNHPLLRQSHLANQESQTGKFSLIYMLNPALSMNLDSRFTSRDYDRSELGLTERTQYQANLGINYMPSRSTTAYIWLSAGDNESEQIGRDFRGGIEKPANRIDGVLPQGSDPSRNWTMEEESETQSVGAGFSRELIENKLSVTADYVYVNTRIDNTFEVFGAVDLAGEALPQTSTKMHQFALSASYYWRPECTFKFSYEYYRYDSDDWAMDGVSLSTIREVLTLGEESPDERINVVSLSASYKF